MSPLLFLLVLPAVQAAAPTGKPVAPTVQSEVIAATGLLSGARPVHSEGYVMSGATGALFDGFATEDSQWEPSMGDDVSMVIQLAEPFDLDRLEVVNSFNERLYPGISVKKLRLEVGASPSGPFQPWREVSLKKGNAPQSFDLEPKKKVRYLRITLLENHGNKEYWSLAELAVYGRRSTPRSKIDFTGVWDTAFGPMRLVQQGQRVTGCYGDGSHLVEGTVEGPIYFGTYDESGYRGAMAFALTSEGDLAGVYGNNITDSKRENRWDGKRMASSELVCGKKENAIADELEEKGRVILRGILFDTGKDVIRAESIPVLESLAKAMAAGGKRSYIIEGHTDDRGGDALNQKLSEQRSASVKKWLTSHGVNAERLKAVGFGQSRPAMANDSEAGRAANRRVEVAVGE